MQAQSPFRRELPTRTRKLPQVYRLGDANPPTEVYVGSTDGAIEDRIEQHFANANSFVMKRGLTVRLHLLTPCSSGDRFMDEEEETMQNMIHLGVNKVRGAAFRTPENNMAGYRMICHRLERCYNCALTGHKADVCTNASFTGWNIPLPY